jgi:GTPase SAR1 family protein
MQKNYDYILKFVIAGSSSVGKSSILRRFADDEFEESYISTIGIDFRFKYYLDNSDLFTSTIATLNCRFGIRQVNSVLEELLSLTIKEHML